MESNDVTADAMSDLSEVLMIDEAQADSDGEKASEVLKLSQTNNNSDEKPPVAKAEDVKVKQEPDAVSEKVAAVNAPEPEPEAKVVTLDVETTPTPNGNATDPAPATETSKEGVNGNNDDGIKDAANGTHDAQKPAEGDAESAETSESVAAKLKAQIATRAPSAAPEEPQARILPPEVDFDKAKYKTYIRNEQDKERLKLPYPQCDITKSKVCEFPARVLDAILHFDDKSDMVRLNITQLNIIMTTQLNQKALPEVYTLDWRTQAIAEPISTQAFVLPKNFDAYPNIAVREFHSYKIDKEELRRETENMVRLRAMEFLRNEPPNESAQKIQPPAKQTRAQQATKISKQHQDSVKKAAKNKNKKQNRVQQRQQKYLEQKKAQRNFAGPNELKKTAESTTDDGAKGAAAAGQAKGQQNAAEGQPKTDNAEGGVVATSTTAATVAKTTQDATAKVAADAGKPTDKAAPAAAAGGSAERKRPAENAANANGQPNRKVAKTFPKKTAAAVGNGKVAKGKKNNQQQQKQQQAKGQPRRNQQFPQQPPHVRGQKAPPGGGQGRFLPNRPQPGGRHMPGNGPNRGGFNRRPEPFAGAPQAQLSRSAFGDLPVIAMPMNVNPFGPPRDFGMSTPSSNGYARGGSSNGGWMGNDGSRWVTPTSSSYERDRNEEIRKELDQLSKVREQLLAIDRQAQQERHTGYSYVGTQPRSTDGYSGSSNAWMQQSPFGPQPNSQSASRSSNSYAEFSARYDNTPRGGSRDDFNKQTPGMFRSPAVDNSPAKDRHWSSYGYQ